jgi:hypothetical protein
VVPESTVLVNGAQIYSDMFDDNNGNNECSNHTIVSRVADLEVIRIQDREISLAGWDIIYTITVTNLGPSDIEGLSISGAIRVQVLDPTWTCCTRSGPSIYTVNGTLDWWPCGPFTNTVTLIPPESLTHPPEDIDPGDENSTDIAVNDPVCHYDPLALKSFPGPDSTD